MFSFWESFCIVATKQIGFVDKKNVNSKIKYNN
jgi:hypothetical protein